MKMENELCAAFGGLELQDNGAPQLVRVAIRCRVGEDERVSVGLEVVVDTGAVVSCLQDRVPRLGLKLLLDAEVVQWMFGDLSFLRARGKQQEDEWGRHKARFNRPDLEMKQQWTTTFGESICSEILCLARGIMPTKPANKRAVEAKKGFQPDLETLDAMWEVKTQTYLTTGTAGEKIMGVPFKYAEVPSLYGKPLRIMCIGMAERLAREDYGLLPGKRCTPHKQKQLDMWREEGITFVGATDMLLEALECFIQRMERPRSG